jgi:hypothetical protein
MLQLKRRSLSDSFWPRNRLLKWNTDPVPLIWLQVTCGCFQKILSALKGRRFQDTEKSKKEKKCEDGSESCSKNVSNSGSIVGLRA